MRREELVAVLSGTAGPACAHTKMNGICLRAARRGKNTAGLLPLACTGPVLTVLTQTGKPPSASLKMGNGCTNPPGETICEGAKSATRLIHTIT